MPEAAKTSGATILVAEDNEDDTLLLKRAFCKAGVGDRVVFVTDGQEAINYLRGLPPYDDPMLCPRAGLLVLDVRMPKLDGIQVLEWIREHPEVGPLTVVLCTSDLSAKNRARAVELGAKDWLEKPVRAEGWQVLAERVREFAGGEGAIRDADM